MHRRSNDVRYLTVGLAIIVLTAICCTNVAAQQPQKSPAAPPAKSQATPVAPAPSSPAYTVPDADRIVLLVRASLLTLNDALQSGNFSVLRDRAAPSF